MTAQLEQASAREAWHEQRRKGIGGSDAGVIAGLSPHKSAYALYFEKIGQAPLSEEENEAMYWGTVLEEPVARRYSEVTGRKLRRQPRIACRKHPFMIGELDRQIVADPRGPGVYEGKTTNAFNNVSGLDDLADHYYIQMQHYIAITGYEWGSFGFLVGGQKLVHFDVDRHQGTIDRLIALETEFWRRVELRDPPPVDGSDSTRELHKTMYPQDNGQVVVIDDDVLIDAAFAYVAAKESIKSNEEDIALIRSRFEAQIKDASKAALPGFGEIWWKTNKPSKKTDWEQVAVDVGRMINDEVFREILDKHTSEKTGNRPFLVKPAKA